MNASPNANAPHNHPDTTPNKHDNGRDANGRFAKGGHGNSYYRRQAELKRMMLESVTDVDVMSTMRVLLGIARGGDLAAIKLFLEYTIGKPNPSVDPDKVALHEWDIQKQTPKIEQVAELMSHGVEPELASTATRDMADIVGACHLATIGRHLMDGQDAEGNQMMPPLEEVEPIGRSVGQDSNLVRTRTGLESCPTGTETASKRSSVNARVMSAKIRAATVKGDNGEDPYVQALLDDLMDAVGTVENGREVVMNYFRHGGAEAPDPAAPDSR